MIRTLYALGWMRFRLFVNSMTRTGRRDTLEQISRAIASVLPVVLAIGMVPSAIVLAVAGYFGGRALAAGHEATPWILAGTRLGLAGLMLAVVLVPLMRASSAGPGGRTRLTLLPISRRLLFGSELTAGLSDPWLALAVPLVLAVPVGLVAGGESAAALMAVAAAALLLTTLAALNAAASLGMTLLFRDRRRGEWLSLAGAALAMLVPVAMTMVQPDDDQPDYEASAQHRAPVPRETPEQRMNPWFVRVLPGGVYADVVAAGVSNAARGGAVPLLGLAAWCTALTFGAGTMHRRLLESPGEGSRRSRVRTAMRGPDRVPGLNPVAAAVARTTMRTTLRTVRGKIAVYFNVVILGMLLAMFRSLPELQLPDEAAFALGQLGTAGGMLFSVLAMQPVMLNLFASDRAGLVRQALAPLGTRDLVLGKLVAGTVLIASSTALCAAVSVALAPGGPWAGWLVLALAFVASQLWLGPLSVLLSALLPKASDLSRLGKPGNPHNLAGLLGFVLATLTLGPPVLAGVVFATDRPGLALGLSAGWTVLAAIASYPLYRWAMAAYDRRAENVMLVALGR